MKGFYFTSKVLGGAKKRTKDAIWRLEEQREKKLKMLKELRKKLEDKVKSLKRSRREGGR